MKRRAIMVVLLLVFGAIVNVAVAWGSVINAWTTYKTKPVALENRHIVSWKHGAPIGMSAPQWCSKSTRFGCSATIVSCEWKSIPGSANDEEGLEEMIIHRAGFPFLSQYGKSYATVTANSPTGTLVERQGDLLSASLRDALGLGGKFIPWIPIWPGFAINTIFYAAMLWLIFGFPFVLRRKRRIKRGLCPACAYPVGSSPVCTECGAAVLPKKDSDVAQDRG